MIYFRGFDMSCVVLGIAIRDIIIQKFMVITGTRSGYSTFIHKVSS